VHAILYAALAVTALAAPVAAQSDVATATLLDGSRVGGTVSEWSTERITLHSSHGTRVLGRQELLDVAWSRETDPGDRPDASGSSVQWLELLDGTRIAITKYAAARRVATFETPHSEKPVRVSVDQVRRVNLTPTRPEVEAVWTQISERELAGDVLVVTTREAGALDYLVGVVGDITDDVVAFSYDGQEIAVKRSKAAAVGYFHHSDERSADPVCLLTLADGSQLAARQLALDSGGSLTVRTPSGARLAIDLNRVVGADFSTGKLTFLSNLTPETVQWTPRIGLPAAAALISDYGLPRNDISFAGSPLALSWPDQSRAAGREIRTYPKGLAVRSGTKLVFRVPEGMRRFKASAGIDPATASQGHVVLQIQADNRVLWENEIDGDGSPAEIAVDLGTARRLQIAVDYGRNLDYGDRLHLVEACFLK
jgi:hypothetical protein